MFVRKKVLKCGTRWSVVYIDDYGVRHEKTAGSTKKSAETLKVELEKQKASGTLGKPKPENPTFSEFCERFIKIKEKEVKATTLADYKQAIKNYLKPSFGNTRMTEITPSQIQAYLAYMGEKEISPATTGKTYRVLKVILRKAISLEIINKDPTIAINPPRVERREMDFLDDEEVKKLLDAAEGDMHPLLSIACFTGLRQGEILALRWQDVDFDMGIIRVVRSYNPQHDFTDLKTSSSRRAVPMIPTLKSFYKECGEPTLKTLLFSNRDGNPIDRSNLITRRFEWTLEKAGVKRVRFHDLRHTYASLCISAGVDPKALQQSLGHSSIQVTMDIYAHLYPGSQDKGMARLEAMFSSGDKIIHSPNKRERDE
ncbi:MAG: site-specific integrase [Actinomycetota bacterium]|nr:site-specific integrase [Actinomycetota bacterium]